MIYWSGKRDLNPRRPAWEASILPLNYSRKYVSRHRIRSCLRPEPCFRLRAFWQGFQKLQIRPPLQEERKRKLFCERTNQLERETGFEPATSTLARLHSTTELLPHLYTVFPSLDAPALIADKCWSGRRDLNPRLQPWQGCTLPLSYSRLSEEKKNGGGIQI